MTPLQRYIKAQKKSGKDIMNLDTFGAIMDDFITANEVQMLITMPKGTNEPEIQDNMGIGPVGQLYFLTAAIAPIFREMLKLFRDAEMPIEEKEQLADGILKLIRHDMLEEE